MRVRERTLDAWIGSHERRAATDHGGDAQAVQGRSARTAGTVQGGDARALQGRSARTAGTALAAGLLALAAPPALAARGHVPGPTLAAKCSAEPCAPGTLEEPAGVAVNEATGEVYVADRAAGLVSGFEGDGGVVAGFGNNGAEGAANGQLSGPASTGVGKLEAGSSTITAVLDLTGPGFAAGDQIKAPGLAPGTTIVSVLSPEVLEVSSPASASEEPASLTAIEHFAAPEYLAVDNDPASPSFGDLYVADIGRDVVDKFTAAGAFIAQLSGASGEAARIDGLAVDGAGQLWVGTFSGPTGGPVFAYSNAEVNVLVRETSAALADKPDQPGFAVDSEDDLYAVSGGFGITGVAKFDSHGTLLDETFFPQAVQGLATEPVGNDVYVDTGAAVQRVGPSGLVEGLPIETLALAGGAGSGVAVSSAAETVYVAESLAGDIEVFTPEPAGAPTVERESVSKVTGESATFEASLNARGASTSYDFEYGACATPSTCASSAYGSRAPAPEGSAGAAFEVVSVPAENVAGLAADTPYHYRLIAHNEHGTVTGPERTFTTQTVGEFALPDARAWEMVSPPAKHGALIAPLDGEAPIQAAAAGGAIAFLAHSPTESGPAGSTNLVSVLGLRGPQGWSSRDMAVPHDGVSPLGPELWAFSEDLSHAIVQPRGEFAACHSPEGAAQPCLSEEASEQTAFLRTDFLNANTSEPCLESSMHCFKPLVTAQAGYANVPPGTKFGEDCLAGLCGPEFQGASSDLAHVVIKSAVPLSSPDGGNLYEWSAGRPPDEQIAPVSILPASEEETAKGEHGQPATGVLGLRGANVRNAVSADGSRVFWTTHATEAGPLYARDVAKGETSLLGEGAFQDASVDGSRMFYTSGSGVQGTLFECHLLQGAAGASECEHGGSELAPEVLGLIAGVSEDGSWVYFVSGADLAAGAGSGEPNLYVRHEGVTSLVAVLSPADSPDWVPGGFAQLGDLTARVSPDGRWVAFMSERPLTGYDNRDALSAKPDEEVYEYHAPSSLAAEPGTLTCASCNPTGARPTGEEAQRSNPTEGGVIGSGAWSASTWLAANVPGWNQYPTTKFHTIYQPRYLSDSGRLFFNAHDALVAQAVNGEWDVYEYEPEGVPAGPHACSPASVSASEVFEGESSAQVDGRLVRQGAGCLALISSGESPQESGFLDASQSGSEVFLMTTAQLSGQDLDGAYDVYDARECTSESPCVPAPPSAPPPCETESSCRPAPTPQPQIFGAPASASFSGPGDIAPAPAKVTKRKLARCRRGYFRNRRHRCVKRRGRSKASARPKRRPRR